MLVLTSYNLKKDCNLSNSNQVTDSIKHKYYFDRTKYKKHKSGFYLSEKNDVFQLNELQYKDSDGEVKMHFWIDSLLFYPHYPYKRQLKEFIDLNTFISDTLGNFEKDKNNVYFYKSSSDGVMRFIVKKADPKTFNTIIDRWGKDKSTIYYETDVVKKADLKTFIVLKDKDSARDKNYRYYRGKRIR